VTDRFRIISPRCPGRSKGDKCQATSRRKNDLGLLILADRCNATFGYCHEMSSVCLSSVTRVYCGQTVGRIKMKLGMQVGLDPGHIVLDGDPALSPHKGAKPPNFLGPCLLWPNGCVISANSGSFRAHCVKVRVCYIIC